MLDIRGISDFTDYFVICTGTSERMLNALADAALDAARTAHDLRARTEGTPRDGWLLVDFGGVVLHLFAPDKRDYYRLEELWGKGKVLLRLQ